MSVPCRRSAVSIAFWPIGSELVLVFPRISSSVNPVASEIKEAEAVADEAAAEEAAEVEEVAGEAVAVAEEAVAEVRL